MRVAVTTSSITPESSWHLEQLRRAFKRQGDEVATFSLNRVSGKVGLKPLGICDGVELDDLDAIVVRPVGMGSVNELFFRMDFLRRLERSGVTVVNSPQAIERAANKYNALALLEESGLPVPRTVVSTNVEDAVRGFEELGGDVVVKPLFGSRGEGTTRVTDPEIALRAFKNLLYYRQAIYLQEFIPHGNRDHRVFVVGDDVAASMTRSSRTWKTNIAQGAQAEPFTPTKSMQEDCLRACRVLGCEVAGVDVLPARRGGYMFTEVNSQPGWRGLQSVTRRNIARLIARHVAELVRSGNSL